VHQRRQDLRIAATDKAIGIERQLMAAIVGIAAEKPLKAE
jgi:hypothetical protein